MHKLFVIALAFLLLSPALSQQDLEEKLERAFKTGLFDFMETDFSPEFLSAISLQQMNELAEEYGQGLLDITKKSSEGNVLVFEMLYEEGYTRDLTIELGSDQRIAGLWFGPLRIPVEKMRSEIESLEGSVSVLLRSRDEVLFSFNKEKPLALGSAFKLYVLAELFRQIEAGEIDLSAIYELREEDKSSGSGMLQSWPAGTPITIATLANLMISISDNTATDILIDIVGRENIERDLELFGMKNDLNHPFLKTKEFFKLKWGLKDEEIERYLHLTPAEKRGFLNALAQRPLPDPLATTQSTLEIEWFASAQEITDLFQRIVDRQIINDKALIDEFLSTLAINPGIREAERFEYAGYKGGSEPGVISLNWMLYSEGEWYFLSFIWNSETGVNETKAIELCESLMLLI